MSLVLVTGGTGFLGRAIVTALLERGERVRVFARRDASDLVARGVELVHGDITDREAVLQACAGCDVVYHVAAMAGIGSRWEPFYITNTLGTFHVIDGCLRHGVPRLVYTSSPSVTFDGAPQCHVNETAPYPSRWLAHYPHSKALAERAVLESHGTKLATCALRPHLIWGPGDQHLIPRLLDRARRGRLVRVGDGTNRIDTIYIDNAADAHIRAADALTTTSRVGGKAYFLSQGEPVNCWDWIDALLAIHNLPPVRRRVSYRFAWTLGAMMECWYGIVRPSTEPPMTRFLAAQLALDHHFDITAARRDLGYSPRVSTDEGMKRLHHAERIR